MQAQTCFALTIGIHYPNNVLYPKNAVVHLNSRGSVTKDFAKDMGEGDESKNCKKIANKETRFQFSTVNNFALWDFFYKKILLNETT